MANELHEAGIDVPGLVSHTKDVEDARAIPPEQHHHIAPSQKNVVNLREWQAEHPHDPAVQVRLSLYLRYSSADLISLLALQTFVELLKNHIRSELSLKHPQLRDEDIPVILHHDRVYEHATASINYTTYDLRRDQDILHPSAGKPDVLIHTPLDPWEDPEGVYPWQYARVLGVYHANVVLPGTATLERVEFFHVRWLKTDTSFASGTEVRRLERVRFFALSTGRAFGFVNPSHIIRACHLIPAFRYGRTSDYLPPSIARDTAGDWKYFCVNR